MAGWTGLRTRDLHVTGKMPLMSFNDLRETVAESCQNRNGAASAHLPSMMNLFEPARELARLGASRLRRTVQHFRSASRQRLACPGTLRNVSRWSASACFTNATISSATS